MSPHAAQFQTALNALLLMTTWGSHKWVDIERHRGGEVSHSWAPVRDRRDRARTVRLVQRLDQKWSPEILIPLPRQKLGWGTVGESTVLWCRIDGHDQLTRARRFRPLPTLVLQEGASSRRLLLWALTEPVSWDVCVDLNRRIAYALRAVQKWADPDLLRIPAPGTCLRAGRSRPTPVRVGRLSTEMFEPAFAGRLRKPPPADAWMTGQRTG
jgi:hypothetical protein